MTTKAKQRPDVEVINGVEVDISEINKMHRAKEDGSQSVGEFLEWLSGEGISLCRWRDDLTDQHTCEGLGREGEVLGFLSTSNCDEGVVARHKVKVGRKSYAVGEQCPRCDGTGKIETKVHEQWVPEGGSPEQVLARFFGVDLQKVDKQQKALLAAMQSPEG